MKTIQELEQYLEENCYNFDSITIGRHYAYEGLVVKNCALGYCLFSSERGHETLLKAFQTEEELVTYTLSYLDRDPWYKAHIVAFTFDQKQIKKAEFKLKLGEFDTNATISHTVQDRPPTESLCTGGTFCGWMTSKSSTCSVSQLYGASIAFSKKTCYPVFRRWNTWTRPKPAG